MSDRRFPEGFVLGAATSAAQIEGSVDADGRGPSIWDTFAATPGTIEDGSDPSIACDHYRRWRDDVGRMRDLGLNAYRFSIAWPRILPQGTGTARGAGLDFYDHLVDELLDAGIQPFATLYHWDLPQVLQDRGGWTSRETVDAFVEYAGVVTARLGDRVTAWTTHNEPWCIAHLGHHLGKQAPGVKDPLAGLTAAHHVLLSHGAALPVIRENAPGAEVGIVLNLVPGECVEDSPAGDDVVRSFDGFFNRWYLDPLFRGRYPEDVIADRVQQGDLPSAELPFVEEGDLDVISRSVDYLGVNYYSRAVFRVGPQGEPVGIRSGKPAQRNDMGWEDYPPGLRRLLVRLHEEYAVPRLYVTENGGAWSDAPDAEGRVRDHRKIRYLHGHLHAALDALDAGVPLRGYFAWSLLDNWEWAHGYPKRFGFYWVDYETQERIAKDSALWYRDVIARHGLDDELSLPV